MNLKSRIKTFSFAYLVVVLLLNSINLAFGLKLDETLSLNSHMILDDFQFWRLFTFPLVFTNAGFVFLFSVIFLIVSPVLENYLNKFLYPVFLFLAAMLEGFFLTLVLWQKDINISGTEGLAFFVLSLLIFLKPNTNLIKKLPISTAGFGVFVLVLWVSSFVLPQSAQGNFSFAESSASAIFGISLGVSIFFPIKFMERFLKKRRNLEETKLQIPTPEELSMAVVSSSFLKKKYNQFEERPPLLSNDSDENEIILNDILDKINMSGKESLDQNEIDFLNAYSRQLQ